VDPSGEAARLKEIVIRPMTEEDLPSVLAIESASFSTPWSRSMFLNELKANPYSNLFTACEGPGGIVVGYVCFWVLLDELYLLNLAVLPAIRRRGLGKELTRFALRFGWEKGARKATLEVRAGNRPAIRLYEKMGFKAAGIRPGYYHEPREDALVMVLEEWMSNDSFTQEQRTE
jgi:ribosomal-protein-alanine N-acetyltransferase